MINWVTIENLKELVSRIKALITAHTSNSTIHMTAAERTKWNAVTNKVDKISGKGLSTNDYTTDEKNKLSKIAVGAEVNVQSDWSVTDTGSDSYIKNKPTSMPASDVPAWAKASTKPSYAWSEIGSKPSTFPPASHTHDDRYYTESEVNTKFQNLNPSYITDGYTSKAFYLNTHPENAGVIIPFINNDLAFLLKRGGSAKVMYDGIEKAVDISTVFDGSPSYWSINPTGVTEIVIELILHKTFTWTNTIYIDFGSASWRAKNIKIDVMNATAKETDWTNKSTLTNYSLGHYKIRMTHNDGTGFNKMRISLSSWNSSSNFRISAIGIVNYGSSGLREVFVPRDGGSLYGSLTPYANNAYDLGSSSKMWRNIYGNSSTATKLVTARKIGSAAFDGSKDVTLSQIGAAPVDQVNQLQENVDRILASHCIDGGDLMDSGPAENVYDGGYL